MERPGINRGTGAGGAQTNFHGKRFEEKTDNAPRLLTQGFQAQTYKKQTFLSRADTLYFTQGGLKKYMRSALDVSMFRCPDEAYLQVEKKRLYILEKKEQHAEGSVETKLWCAHDLKREYELVLGDYEIIYGFCVNDFLKKKIVSGDSKWNIFNIICQENNVAVLFGDDDDYFETLDVWLGSKNQKGR